MKRRVRSHPTNPYYSSEPAVATSAIADKPPVQSASLGNKAPKMVDKNPARMSGIAGFSDKHKLPQKKGNIPAQAQSKGSSSPFPKKGGYHKMSGHPGAHMLGIKKIKGL
jgi:hypothetical protein